MERVTSVVAPRASDSRRLVLLLLGFALVPRLVLFPFNENLYGDAISRTEFAERWLRQPHLITAFGDGASQYGPLHLYLIGLALTVFDRADAGRVVALVFGVLTVVPLFALTRRMFDVHAAAVACVALSLWGLHLQFSTTAASEALALFLMAVVFACYARALDTNRLPALACAAVALNLACAVRYDAWMFIPLLAVVPFVVWRGTKLSRARTALFFVWCLPFPMFWMWGNDVHHGDPLFAFRYIDEFHRGWIASASGGWRELWMRAQGIGFWPAIALFSLTPGVAGLGLFGMVTAWRTRPDTRWVVACAFVPIAYYAFRTTVLFNFVPLSRFIATELTLILPFVVPGYRALVDRAGPIRAWQVARVSVVLLVVMPLALGVYTFRRDGGAHDVLRPLSPTSTNRRSVMQAARFIEREVADSGGTVALDHDATYLDLQVGFFAGVPEERVVRLRWPAFDERMRELQPEVLVRFDQGLLAREPGVALHGKALGVGAAHYVEIEGFAAPVHVYRRVR
jgi:4-amino-4-deoxy-L-arabinose transferase-like glycosyltransferase